jgi:hypothetical protein
VVTLVVWRRWSYVCGSDSGINGLVLITITIMVIVTVQKNRRKLGHKTNKYSLFLFGYFLLTLDKKFIFTMIFCHTKYHKI